MIDSKSLRLGNLIKTKNEEIVEVAAIADNMVAYNVGKGMITVKLYDVEDFDPIPLTEEWLIKFRFHLVGQSYVNELYDDIAANSWIELKTLPKGGVRFIMEAMNPDSTMALVKPVMHVHTLQNLIYLITGKELNLI